MATYLLGFIGTRKMGLIVKAQAVALAINYVLQCGNSMLLTSFFASSLLSVISELLNSIIINSRWRFFSIWTPNSRSSICSSEFQSGSFSGSPAQFRSNTQSQRPCKSLTTRTFSIFSAPSSRHIKTFIHSSTHAPRSLTFWSGRLLRNSRKLSLFLELLLCFLFWEV